MSAHTGRLTPASANSRHLPEAGKVAQAECRSCLLQVRKGSQSFTLLEEPMVAALSSSHERAGGGLRSEPLPLRALAGEPFILFGGSVGPGIADASLAACHRAGFSPRLGQQAPRIASTLGLVSVGLGVALVPASIQRVRVDGVAYRRLLPGERPAAVLNLALRRGNASAVVRNFFELVRRAARYRKWGREELG